MRLFDRRGRIEPARKRCDRTLSSLLADLIDHESLAALSIALRLRSDTEIVDWMSWPDLWLEFTDEQGLALVTLGVLRPDWLRWDPHGDLQLDRPDLLNSWLSERI